jgi:hypothetical protein
MRNTSPSRFLSFTCAGLLLVSLGIGTAKAQLPSSYGLGFNKMQDAEESSVRGGQRKIRLPDEFERLSIPPAAESFRVAFRPVFSPSP